MSINIGNDAIDSVYWGNDEIAEIYFGSDLVYASYSDVPQYIFRDIDNNGKLTTSSGALANETSVKKISDYGLAYAFNRCPNLTGAVTFTNLKSINKDHSFYSCFFECTGLTSASFPNLTKITNAYSCYKMFQGCTGLTSVSFPNLEIIGDNKLIPCGYMFYGCTGLTSVSFPKLSVLSTSQALQYAFAYCTSLTSLSFPALTSQSFGRNWTNQFQNMLQGNGGICTVHFPSNLQSVIGSWSDVTNKFGGGTNCQVLFDLPATS